ncbi:hypothetical protein ACFTWH_22630 [Streptomyces sp. NPDC057011]
MSISADEARANLLPLIERVNMEAVARDRAGVPTATGTTDALREPARGAE